MEHDGRWIQLESSAAPRQDPAGASTASAHKDEAVPGGLSWIPFHMHALMNACSHGYTHAARNTRGVDLSRGRLLTTSTLCKASTAKSLGVEALHDVLVVESLLLDKSMPRVLRAACVHL